MPKGRGSASLFRKPLFWKETDPPTRLKPRPAAWQALTRVDPGETASSKSVTRILPFNQIRTMCSSPHGKERTVTQGLPVECRRRSPGAGDTVSGSPPELLPQSQIRRESAETPLSGLRDLSV
jgi:hypothetical protein